MTERRSALVLVVLACALLGSWCGEEGEGFHCDDPRRVVEVPNLHYVEIPCSSETLSKRRSDPYIRQVCQQLAPMYGLPGPVLAIERTRCVDTDDGGSRVDLRVCCPDMRP